MFGVKMCKIIIMQHTDTSVSVPIGHRDSRMNCCTISMNFILNAKAMYINLSFFMICKIVKRHASEKILSFHKVLYNLLG